MKKLITFTIIFILILGTSLIKNSTKVLDEQIFSVKENILFLESRYKDSKIRI